MAQELNNIVYDTDYASFVPHGGYPVFVVPNTQPLKKKSLFDQIMDQLFPPAVKKNTDVQNAVPTTTPTTPDGKTEKKKDFFDKVIDTLFPSAGAKKNQETKS